MKRFVTLASVLALALPPVGAPSVSFAAGKQFHKYCDHGIVSADDFANKLAKSIAADPTGHTRMVGCWATPVQVVASFAAAAPEEGVTLANVVDVVRNGLVEKTLTSSVTFYTSCVKGRSSGPEDVKMDCQEQTLQAGTKVLASRKTGKNLVKMDCANVGFTPIVRVACAVATFEVRKGSEVRAHIPVYGGFASNACHGYRKVSGGHAGAIQEFAPGCIEQHRGCTYDDTDRHAPRARTGDLTIDDLSPGTYEILVDPRAARDATTAFGICIETYDAATGRWGTSSETALVLSANYRQRHGRLEAKVYYSSDEQPSDERADPQQALYLYQ